MTKKRKAPAQSAHRPMTRRALLKSSALTMASIGLGKLPLAAAPLNALGFCPISAGPGEQVRLFGPSFGASYADVSAKVISGNNIAFFNPLSFSSSELICELSAVPPAMMSGTVQAVLGTGAHWLPSNMPTGLTLSDPIRVWLGNGGSRFTAYQTLDFPTSGSGNCLSYWGSLNLGRLDVDLVIPFDADCCPACPAGSRLTLRLCGATSGNAFECEYQASLITTTKLYTTHIADALCALLISAFDTEFSITMSCTQTVVDDTRVTLSVGTPDASSFVSGAIHIEISHDTDSMSCDSTEGDSAGGDSLNGDSTGGDSVACDSIAPGCDSISIDFVPFIFS